MKLTWTKAVEAHFLKALKNNSKAIAIKISVKKTGCSGYGYSIEPIESLSEDLISLPFVDHYILVVDKQDLPLLNGIHIDYVTQGVNSKLVFSNPNQTGQCGCGESFTV